MPPITSLPSLPQSGATATMSHMPYQSLTVEGVNERLKLVLRGTPTDDVFISGSASGLLQKTSELGRRRFETSFGKFHEHFPLSVHCATARAEHLGMEASNAIVNGAILFLTSTLISSVIFAYPRIFAEMIPADFIPKDGFLLGVTYAIVLLDICASLAVLATGVKLGFSGLGRYFEVICEHDRTVEFSENLKAFFDLEHLMTEEPAIIESGYVETIEIIDELLAYYQIQTSTSAGNTTSDKKFSPQDTVELLTKLRAKYEQTLDEFRAYHTNRILLGTSYGSSEFLKKLTERKQELLLRLRAQQEVG